jgi:hypothetical protein
MRTRAWLSVRRYRRSPRYDIGAGALVLLLVIVASAGVYAVVLAAVAFVAWLLRVAMRPRPEAAAEPPPQAPTSAPYRAVLPVDPAVFADDAEAKAVAKRVFEQWVGGLPRAPARSIDLVRAVDLRTRQVGRLVTELEGRRVVECCEPAPGREPPRPPPFVRQSIDPWNPPQDLPRVSRFIAACWTCGASGRVECAACRGTARRPCTGCDGSGKYYGQAANGAHRLLNCKTCRGKGEVRCADCTRGKVDCQTCQQARKLACWLEIRSDLRQDVQLAPEAAATLPFSWCRGGALVSDDQLALDARIVDKVTRTRPIAVAELPVTVPPEWRSEHGPRMQAHVEPGERVRSQAFSFLSVPFASVTYAVLGEQHAVALEGLRMLAPPVTAPAAEPFARRARMLGRLALAFAALPVAIAAIYAGRGEYFTGGRATGLVGCVAIAAAATAALAYAALWNVTLGRRRARTWATAAIAPVAIASVLAGVAEPRLGRARDLLDAGRLEEATAELRALNLPEADAAWADLHLRRSLEASTCATATAELRPIPPEQPQRGRAQAHADQLAIAETEAAIRARDSDAAATALGCTSELVRTSPTAVALRAQIVDLQAGRCLQRKDWACALDRAASGSDPAALRAEALAAVTAEANARIAAAASEPSLDQRIADEEAALDLWQRYLLDPQHADAPPRLVIELRATLARDQAALATQQRIAQARAEAEARRQAAAAERERKQAELAAERERRRQAAEAERANRSSGGLLCNDGTLSPTCTCAGSHRGCCSWHGGVAGCQ